MKTQYDTNTSQRLVMIHVYLFKLSSLILSTYDRFLPQLNRVHLNNITSLTPTTIQHLQCLQHLKLVKCSSDEFYHIFQNIPTLQSLDVCLNMNSFSLGFALPYNQLIRLDLVIISECVKTFIIMLKVIRSV